VFITIHDPLVGASRPVSCPNLSQARRPNIVSRAWRDAPGDALAEVSTDPAHPPPPPLRYLTKGKLCKYIMKVFRRWWMHLIELITSITQSLPKSIPLARPPRPQPEAPYPVLVRRLHRERHA